MKGSSITTSFALLVLAAFAEARNGGLRSRNLQTTSRVQEIYFSEMLAADESVVILEDGPVKLVASCKTIDYDMDYYSSTSSFSNTPSSYSSMGMGNYSSSSYLDDSPSSFSHHMTRSSSASHYFPYSSGSTSTECYNPCGTSYSSSSGYPWGPSSSGPPSFSHDFDDDYSSTSSTMEYREAYTPAPTAHDSKYPKSDDDDLTSFIKFVTSDDDFDDDHVTSDDYYSTHDYSYMWYDYSESIAALELTYTAKDADYVYGSPSYANYPNETVLVGAYKAGESRTQTIFAGRDGAYGDMSTLQSTSGYMCSTGDSTIGIHKEWAEYLPGGMDSFPEGVECMVAGIFTYVTPNAS